MEIQDFEDYLIYDDGRVYNKKYKRLLKSCKNTRVYEHVVLCKNGKKKHGYIHRLVALHYLDNPENKSDVDHIDGNKLNNHVSNLRWTTNIENCNNYQSIRKNNTSGFKNISKYKNGFQFNKNIYGEKYQKYHKNLNELLWYKLVILILLK